MIKLSLLVILICHWFLGLSTTIGSFASRCPGSEKSFILVTSEAWRRSVYHQNCKLNGRERILDLNFTSVVEDIFISKYDLSLVLVVEDHSAIVIESDLSTVHTSSVDAMSDRGFNYLMSADWDF